MTGLMPGLSGRTGFSMTSQLPVCDLNAERQQFEGVSVLDSENVGKKIIGHPNMSLN